MVSDYGCCQIRDRGRSILDPEEIQNRIESNLYERYEAAKFRVLVQPMSRLPRFAMTQWRQFAPHFVEPPHNRRIDSLLNLGQQAAFP